jgi:hypothetical protein
MGDLNADFKFDSRCHHRPRIAGKVIASVSVSRELGAILQLYPVAISEYGPTAALEFKERVLPNLKRWLVLQLSRPQTAVLGCEQRIIEWTSLKHREHDVRYL